jgi:ankyrin repeat protein
MFLQSGEVSLHAAVHCGHVGVVKALLNKGASVDTKTKVTSLINNMNAFLSNQRILLVRDVCIRQ